MSELAKQLVWPTWITPVNDLANSPKTGVTVAAYRTGAEIRRTYQDRALAVFSARFFLSPLLDGYEDDMVWFRSIEDGLGTFLFMNPHKDYNFRDIIGVGDGVRTTWVAHYVNNDGKPHVYRDNRLAVNYQLHPAPNILSFAQSLGDFNSGELSDYGTGVFTGSSDHRVANNCYNRSVTKIVNASPTASFCYGLEHVKILDGHNFNALCDVIGGTLIDGVAVLDASAGPDTPVVTDGWTAIIMTVTSPGTTIHGSPGGGIGSTPGIVYVGAIAGTHGDLMTWYPGEVEMPTIVFNTPPAVGSIIAYGSEIANRMVRVKCSSLKHAVQPDGNRFIDVTLEEVPE